MNQTRSHVARKKLNIACWVLFFAGTLVQLAAPRLKIEHNQFVIPQSMINAKKNVSPSAIVARERWMQLLSVVLTVGGGLGLAVCYRRTLLLSSAYVLAPLTRTNRISGRRHDAVV